MRGDRSHHHLMQLHLVGLLVELGLLMGLCGGLQLVLRVGWGMGCMVVLCREGALVVSGCGGPDEVMSRA